MTAVMYAQPSDLQQALSGTDSGTGTAAQLSQAQLTQSLVAASTRISIFAGQVWDSSSPEAVPPQAAFDLCLDLAMFYATVTYMKHKQIGPNDPVLLRYKDAMTLLVSVRDGKVRLDPLPGGAVAEPGKVINRIPRVFTHQNSNVRYDPITNALEPSSPPDMFTPNWLEFDTGMGAVYQG